MRKARRAAARRGRRLRIMFADEARFGRMNRPRPCWAPIGIRPEVASQLIREYIYLYGAVCPKDGTCVYLIMPTSDTACFQIFLDVLRESSPDRISCWLSTVPPIIASDDLVVPDNITLLLPAALLAGAQPQGKSLGRNSRENLQELRPQIHGRRPRQKLEEAILTSNAIRRLVKSITSFPYIVKSL